MFSSSIATGARCTAHRDNSFNYRCTSIARIQAQIGAQRISSETPCGNFQAGEEGERVLWLGFTNTVPQELEPIHRMLRELQSKEIVGLFKPCSLLYLIGVRSSRWMVGMG